MEEEGGGGKEQYEVVTSGGEREYIGGGGEVWESMYSRFTSLVPRRSVIVPGNEIHHTSRQTCSCIWAPSPGHPPDTRTTSFMQLQ